MIKIIVIILIVLIVLAVLAVGFFYFIVWGFSSGLYNKYGPEWIPKELGLRFGTALFQTQDNKNFTFSIDQFRIERLKNEIEAIIESNPIERKWIKVSDLRYEFFKDGNNMPTAVFDIEKNELTYYSDNKR